MHDSPLNNVNPHYLNRVVELSATRHIEASEDVYNAVGMKLIAKGTRISAEMQERLLRHKLKKPLESSLAVEDGVHSALLLDLAERVINSDVKVQPILLIGNHAVEARAILGSLPLSGPVSMLLTLLQKGGENELLHAVEGAMVGLVLGLQAGVPRANLPALAAGALLHDIGELYINPEYLRSGASLKPHEWRHVASHPLVGRMLVDELGQFPALAGQIVLEHHERLDGSGYPRRIAGDQLSLEGLIVGVADTICAVFRHYGKPLARAEIAMRIVPGQFPLRVTQIVNLALRNAKPAMLEGGDLPSAESMAESMHQLLRRLAQVLIRLDEAEDDDRVQQFKPALLLAQRAAERVRLIQLAFSSTGLDSLPHGEHLQWLQQVDRDLLFEVIVAIEEIAWRLRELGRDLQLRSEDLPEDVRSVFVPLIDALHSAHG